MISRETVKLSSHTQHPKSDPMNGLRQFSIASVPTDREVVSQRVVGAAAWRSIGKWTKLPISTPSHERERSVEGCSILPPSLSGGEADAAQGVDAVLMATETIEVGTGLTAITIGAEADIFPIAGAGLGYIVMARFAGCYRPMQRRDFEYAT